ncbi:hypothetical protein [Streptomyces sp. NBC_00316]|uniref:hypothetical protein n=1 Tax=Streptomyces sp. NBC_00316 TaxID=2975710 RepID=UPI002E290133|nr:hypothetical protein [Streptomyces sp. NBC_00316]
MRETLQGLARVQGAGQGGSHVRESVVLGGFRMDDDTAAFHPGKARTEFLRGHTG